eukprot:scaffold11177_cov103-Alexandrium_tamarense.AAC.1
MTSATHSRKFTNETDLCWSQARIGRNKQRICSQRQTFVGAAVGFYIKKIEVELSEMYDQSITETAKGVYIPSSEQQSVSNVAE